MIRSRFTSRARFCVVLVAYLIARLRLLGRLDGPTFSWRPTDLAGIAINYYRNGFHFAYPQVMWGGAGLGHVEMEFPLQPFVTALLFKVFGLHDWLCVVLPLSFGFGIVWVVSEFAGYLFGELAAFAAGVNLALSPTLVYITTTGMWADPPMVFFGTLGIYLLTRWSTGERGSRWLWLGVASVALAILCKLSALYLGFVVLLLFLRRHGLAFWKMPSTWLAAGAIVLPAALWYRHAYGLYLEDGNTFGIIGGGYLKFPTWLLLRDSYIYKHTLVRIAVYHLTPLGFIAFVLGVAGAIQTRHALLLVWLAAVVLHTFVVFAGIQYSGNIGYLLPILPICNLLVGLGFRTVADWMKRKAGTRFRPRLYVPLLGAVAVFFGTSTLVASQRFTERDMSFETALWEKKKLTGLKVAQVTRPGALIIVTDHEMDAVDQKHSMTPPDVFFFGDRRGWYLSVAWLTVPAIERLRRQGAEYFVVSLQSVEQFKNRQPLIRDYLERTFRKVTDQDGIIYSLTTPTSK